MKLTIKFSEYIVILMFLVGIVSNGYNKFYGQSLVTNFKVCNQTLSIKFYLNLSVQFYILLIVKLKTWVIYL